VTMFDHVYHGPHAQLEQERAWFQQYHRSFADPDANTDAEGVTR